MRFWRSVTLSRASFSLVYGVIPTAKDASKIGRNASKQRFCRTMNATLLTYFPSLKLVDLSRDTTLKEWRTFLSLTFGSTRLLTYEKVLAPCQHQTRPVQASDKTRLRLPLLP